MATDSSANRYYRGDGMCCSLGNGSYSLVNSAGTVFASGGQFTTFDLKPFSVTESSTYRRMDTSAATVINHNVFEARQHADGNVYGQRLDTRAGSRISAYIRAFGASLGKDQDFCGPGAKPHRMFLLTVGCLAAAGCDIANLTPPVIPVTVIAIASLTAITACRRTVRLYRKMSSE